MSFASTLRSIFGGAAEPAQSQARSKTRSMNIRTIDSRFAVTSQISPDELEAVAAAGYKAVLCARPDGEDPGQPAFATIAEAAGRHGLAAVHIPVSGSAGSAELTRFAEVMRDLPGPVLGYCRSGARAGALYSTLPR